MGCETPPNMLYRATPAANTYIHIHTHSRVGNSHTQQSTQLGILAEGWSSISGILSALEKIPTCVGTWKYRVAEGLQQIMLNSDIHSRNYSNTFLTLHTVQVHVYKSRGLYKPFVVPETYLSESCTFLNCSVSSAV